MDQASSGGDTVLSLPWGCLIRNGTAAQAGTVPLTLPITLGLFAVLGGLFSLFALRLAFHPSYNDSESFTAAMKSTGSTGLFVSGLTMLVCLVWHKRRAVQPGDVPDLLAALFPAFAIYEKRCLQVAAFTVQVGSTIRVAIALENLCQGPAHTEWNLPDFPDVPLLVSTLGDGEVALHCLDIPIPCSMGQVRFGLKCRMVSCTGRVRRHYPRAALRTRQEETFFRALVALASHIHWADSTTAPQSGVLFMSEVGEFNLLVQPDTAAQRYEGRPRMEWMKLRLGTMNDLSNVSVAAERIANELFP